MSFLLRTVLILQIFIAVSLYAAEPKFDFSKLSNHFVNQKGEKVKLDTQSNKYILIYYSSNWCGTCREFTPKLIDFYKKHNKDLFEVVFMSLDFSEKKQLAYMQKATMPWIAVEYSQLKPSGLFEYVGCVMPWIAVFDSEGNFKPDNKLNLVTSTSEEVFAKLKKIMSIPNE